MRFILLGVCFAMSLSQVLAQATSSATITSSAPAATYTVNVGAEGLVFTPNQTTAAVGDIIEFRFYPQNHSVARADFKIPCIPYEDSGVGREGFWSGFHPMSVVLSNPPTFQVTVNDTDPIFFYCSAPGACISDGMVGVINPTENETFAIQEAFAKNSTLMFSPGEYFPSEGLPTTSATASSTGTSSTLTATAASAATPSATPSSSKSGLSGGAIAGIAIGGAAILILAAALLYLCGRQRTLGEILQHNARSTAPPSYFPDQGHMSMNSSATYPPKMANMEINPLGAHRYSSSQAGTYDRSAAEIESYRSRSPPADEGPELMVGFNGALGVPSHGRNSPIIRRPVPESPGRNPMSPLSPASDSYPQTGDPNIPLGLRPNRATPQLGPHELDVQSGRDYIPYTPIEPRDPRHGNFGPNPP